MSTTTQQLTFEPMTDELRYDRALAEIAIGLLFQELTQLLEERWHLGAKTVGQAIFLHARFWGFWCDKEAAEQYAARAIAVLSTG